jgi:hypothetical protein
MHTGKSRERILLIIGAIAGLLLTLIPSVMNWQGAIVPERVNNLMLAGTIVWFVSAGFLFMKKDPD